MSEDRPPKGKDPGLPDEALLGATSPSGLRANGKIDPELQRWLDEPPTRRPQSPKFFVEFGDALPYIFAMVGVLAFALLAGWALRNLP